MATSTWSNTISFTRLGPPGNTPPTKTTSGSFVSSSDFHSGVSNPNYRRQIALKVNATTPYIREVFNQSSVSVQASGSYKDPGLPKVPKAYISATGSMNPASFPFGTVTGYDYTSLDAAASTQAYAEYLNRVNGGKSQLGATLGELRETIRMLHHPGALLGDITSQWYTRSFWKKTKPRSLKRVEALNDAYLEWTFGVRPLVHDVQNIAKAIASIATTGGVQREVATVSKRSDALLSSVTEIGMPDVFWFKAQGSTQHSVTVTVGGGHQVVLNDLSDYLSVFYGLNTGSVLTTAWELLPFSFVADYVANINSLLSIAAHGNSDHVYMYTSKKSQSVSKVMYMGGRAVKAGYNTTFDGGTITGERSLMRFSRVNGGPGNAGFSMRLPSFGQVLNMQSLLTAFAINRVNMS